MPGQVCSHTSCEILRSNFCLVSAKVHRLAKRMGQHAIRNSKKGEDVMSAENRITLEVFSDYV